MKKGIQLSRRSLLTWLGAIPLAAFAPSLKAHATVVEGYIKPYGVGATFVFSKIPLHCFDCFAGDHDTLMLVEFADTHPRVTGPVINRVRLTGDIQKNSHNKGLFKHTMRLARIVKNPSV